MTNSLTRGDNISAVAVTHISSFGARLFAHDKEIKFFSNLYLLFDCCVVFALLMLIYLLVNCASGRSRALHSNKILRLKRTLMFFPYEQFPWFRNQTVASI